MPLFEGLVVGCIEADVCNQIFILQHVSSSTRFAHVSRRSRLKLLSCFLFQFSNSLDQDRFFVCDCDTILQVSSSSKPKERRSCCSSIRSLVVTVVAHSPSFSLVLIIDFVIHSFKRAGSVREVKYLVESCQL